MAPHQPRPRENGDPRVVSTASSALRSQEAHALGALPAVDLRELQERLDGDEALGRELLQLFVDESAPMVARIREALAQPDLSAVAREAHSLKGAAAYVSATAAREIATALEAAAQRKEAAAADALLAPLEQALRALRALLERA